MYQVIYADPPWTYRDKARAGDRGAACKYPVMTLPEIAALSVQAITLPDCALFLWATNPLLAEALHVMAAWGFTYKTVAFNWIKVCQDGVTGKMGMGHWTRTGSELCLLGIRGRPKRVNAAVRQVVHAKVTRHSEKPHEVRERIVELLGDVPRVELFAREKFAGWAAWGNEIRSDIHLSYNLKQLELPHHD